MLPEFTRRKSSTVNEVAAHWRCDPQLIYRRIRRGHIRAFKVGGLWRIPADEIDRIEATGPSSTTRTAGPSMTLRPASPRWSRAPPLLTGSASPSAPCCSPETAVRHDRVSAT